MRRERRWPAAAVPVAMRALTILAAAALAGCASPLTGVAAKPGASLQDCSDCPLMVVIPPGSFVMGSPAAASPRDADEGPQRTVRIARPFALSKHEITRAQFRQFIVESGHVAAGNCSVWTGSKSERIAERNWQNASAQQTDAHPVACVSWEDAKAYVAWLARRTRKPYRLPSEAEWEYAALAGSSGAYSFGDDPDELCRHGNVADLTAREAGGGANWTYANCRDGFGLATAPVGSFAANRFGLHDMHGNVWEWVEDCYHDSYAGAPVDGSARADGECRLRVDRGGGWYNNRGTNRAAERASYPPANSSGNIGLRVALSLDRPLSE